MLEDKLAEKRLKRNARERVKYWERVKTDYIQEREKRRIQYMRQTRDMTRKDR